VMTHANHALLYAKMGRHRLVLLRVLGLCRLLISNPRRARTWAASLVLVLWRLLRWFLAGRPVRST
jgi:hypothetical protein